MSVELKDLIKHYADEINENEFEHIYDACNSTGTRELASKLTSILYAAGIDPLMYLKTVPENFLYFNKDIKEIKVPSNIDRISKFAFYGSEIENIQLSENITRLEKCTFGGCDHLKSIELPNHLQEIGTEAFYNSRLTEIKLPASVTMIRMNAFRECNDLSKVTLEDLSSYLKCDLTDDTSCPFFAGEAELYIDGNLVKELVIPEGIESINSFAFTGCSSIESVEIPHSVTSIGLRVFSSCGNLYEIYYKGTSAQFKSMLSGVLPYRVTIFCDDGAFPAPSFD